jgi:hypothetical protein
MDSKTNGVQLFMVSPEKLSPHPLIEQHFTPGTEEEIEILMRSIKESGVVHPIVAKEDGQIISGRDRWTATKALSLAAVPVRFMKFKSPVAEEMAILAANLCVRAVSPVVAARGSERMEELRSSNGRTSEVQFSVDLSSADQRRLARAHKRELEESKRKARDEGYEEGKKDSEKRVSEVVRQAEKSKTAVGDLIEKRDKLEGEVEDLRQELKEGKAKLAKQINALKSKREEEARKATKEIDKLQAQLKKIADRVVEDTADVGSRERRLLALALQISRVGPEVLVPCIVEMIGGKDRKKEISDALHKLDAWSSEMKQGLGGV